MNQPRTTARATRNGTEYVTRTGSKITATAIRRLANGKTLLVRDTFDTSDPWSGKTVRTTYNYREFALASVRLWHFNDAIAL